MVLDQLGEIEYQEKACELALRLSKSGKSVFSGFLPSDFMIGTSGLHSFQSKIVQLEMKKKALSVEFPSSTREIQAITEEINGIRKHMEETISQHLLFLHEKKQDLLARKIVFEEKVSYQFAIFFVICYSLPHVY